MNGQALATPISLQAVLDALPVGVALVDAGRRIILMNPAFHASLGLPPNAFPPGTRVEDAVRASALRGVYGPGDPEAQVAAIMAADHTLPGRLRRRMYEGRSFDLHNSPLEDGAYVVSAVETTALIAARGDAERALGRTVAALSASRIGLATFDPDGRLVFSNPRFGTLFGLASERLEPGMSFQAILDLMASRDEFGGAEGASFIATQRAAKRNQPWSSRRLRSTGQVIDTVSDPLVGGGWSMTVTDITPLARAEDEAKRRARMLDSILAAVPHGICVYGPDRRVTLFNQAYSRVMAGAPLEIGDHMADIVRRRAESGEYGEGGAGEIFAQQMAFDIARPQMRRRRRPDGTAIDIRTAPLPDGGHISVVTDITPLVQAEAEAGSRVEQMGVMLANIRHGVLLWGADRRLLASNAMAAELMGHPPGLLIPGRSETEILDHMLQRGEWGDGERGEAAARTLRDLDRTVPYVRQVVTKAGRVLDTRSDPAPGGGWISTYTDVTEARVVEEELRRAKEVAEAANLAKSRFLATMSHELRTPLNSVIGFSDALLRESARPSAARPSADRVTEFAQQINDAGRQLLGLINIILDVARIEAGRFDLAEDPVDVGRMVRAAVRQSDSSAQAAEITLVADLPDGLPILRSDERRLQQALMQLLSNAIKFTDAGGSVTVGATLEAGGDLLLYVQDTGIGIPGEDLERVFEPFTQLDSTLSRRYQGAGLGLYIARALVVGHGGRLTLRSAPGAGTTAVIRMPASRLTS